MNYSEEEKEAIKNAKEVLKFTTYLADIGHKDLEILLNLIQKQDKIINDIKFITYNNKPHITQEKLIEYFKKVVDKNVKD